MSIYRKLNHVSFLWHVVITSVRFVGNVVSLVCVLKVHDVPRHTQYELTNLFLYPFFLDLPCCTQNLILNAWRAVALIMAFIDHLVDDLRLTETSMNLVVFIKEWIIGHIIVFVDHL